MKYIALLGALLIAVLAAALVRGAGPEKSLASSHREAPVISEDPAADNTDVYAFVSPDRPDTVTIVANYIPLEEPAGGPNFNEFADDVLYELKVDSNGDGREDVAYQFEFSHADPERRTRSSTTPARSTRSRTRTGTGRRRTRSPGSTKGQDHGPRPGPADARRSTSGRARPRTTARSCRPPSGSSPAGSRSSRASATIRSSSISARCSTWPACGRSTPPTSSRSTRTTASTASAASTRTPSCCRSRSRSSPATGSCTRPTTRRP